MIYITRKSNFNAAHRLHNSELSDKENKELFGICNNKNGHGHNYMLEVTVKGVISNKTGMVINLTELKQIVYDNIIKHVDHKNLNYDVWFMKDTIPTTENLVIKFWNILKAAIPKEKCELHMIRVFETRNNFITYKGE